MPPAQQVQRPTPAPSTGPTQALSPGADATRQSALGNSGTRDRLGLDGAVQDGLPSEMALQEAGISFHLPGDLKLTGGWNPLMTTSPTGVWLSVSRRELRVTFSPPLLVDATWPLSNVEYSGFTYDFTRGAVSRVDVRNTQFAIPVAGKVDEAVRGFVTSLMRGTKAGRAGYDPMADADLAATLQQIQGNFHSGAGGAAGGGDPLQAEQLTGLGGNATFRMTRPIEVGQGGAGMSMPAGATVSVSVSVDGNGATIGKGAPNVQSAYLSSSDLTLVKDGKPIARLRSLRIDRGGRVDVTDFEPLGVLAELGAGESLIRLLGIYAALNGADPRLAGGGNIRPDTTHAVAESQLEKGLTDVVQKLIRDNRGVVPGMDLTSVFGVAPTRS